MAAMCSLCCSRRRSKVKIREMRERACACFKGRSVARLEAKRRSHGRVAAFREEDKAIFDSHLLNISIYIDIERIDQGRSPRIAARKAGGPEAPFFEWNRLRRWGSGGTAGVRSVRSLAKAEQGPSAPPRW